MNTKTHLFSLKLSERIGLLFLISILTILLIGRYYFMENILPPKEDYSAITDTLTFHEIERDTFTYQKNNYKKKYSKNYKEKNYSNYNPKKSSYKKKENKKIYTYFAFDPNTLSEDSLKMMGINNYSAKNMIKYREKGGYFKKAEDLKRIYGLKPETYEKIKEYINISTKQKDSISLDIAKDTVQLNKDSASIKAPFVKVEINGADTTLLKTVPGIGPYYAKEIVKLRNKLGGFHSYSQLMDIYKMDEEKLAKLEPYLDIDPNMLKKIKINEVEADIIGKHPYIKWNEARIIVNYRNQHGNFTASSDLEKIHIFDNEYVNRISPYLVY